MARNPQIKLPWSLALVLLAIASPVAAGCGKQVPAGNGNGVADAAADGGGDAAKPETVAAEVGPDAVIAADLDVVIETEAAADETAGDSEPAADLDAEIDLESEAGDPDAGKSDIDVAPEEAADSGDGDLDVAVADLDAAAGAETLAAETTATGDVAAEAAGACDLDVILEPVAATATGAACPSKCVPPYPCGCDGCAWLKTPDMNQARVKGRALWTGQEVLVFGGWENVAKGTGQQEKVAHWDVEHWNPTTNQWIQGPAMPPPKSGLADTVGVWTGKYAVVGNQGGFIYRYEPETKTWAEPTPTDLAWVGAMVYAGGKVIVGGAQLGFFGEFDPETMKYKALGVPKAEDVGMQTTYDTCGSAVCSYIQTGCMVSDGTSAMIFDAWEYGGITKTFMWPDGTGIDRAHGIAYNPTTGKWSTMAVAPPGLKCKGISSSPHILAGGFPGGMMVFGTLVDYKATNNAAIYWSQTDAWAGVAEAGLPSPRTDVILQWTGKWMAVVGGFGKKPGCPWIWGGCGSGALYDPFGDKWQPIPQQAAVHDGRADEMVVSSGAELFVLGGMDGPCCTNVYHKDGRRWHLPP